MQEDKLKELSKILRNSKRFKITSQELHDNFDKIIAKADHGYDIEITDYHVIIVNYRKYAKIQKLLGHKLPSNIKINKH